MDNQDIKRLKELIKRSGEEPDLPTQDRVMEIYRNFASYELACWLKFLAPQIVEYFEEKAKCKECDGTGITNF